MQLPCDIPLEIENVYRILPPAGNPAPVIFDSPHSGYHYPEDFGHSAELDMLRRAEDPHIDDLYSPVVNYGASLLMALFPRNYVDVNRALDDIDDQLLSEPWPSPIAPTIRSAAGHGLVHRLIKSGVPIYNRQLSISEITHRINHYYNPYHAALKCLLDDAVYKFGQVWHINCHSMSSLAAKEGSAFQVQFGEADFVLGDRDGTTCDPQFANSIKSFLTELGYKVYVNTPYKGAEIVQRYSAPEKHRHSLQIEINKSLYMNEASFEKSSNYNSFKSDLQKLIGFIGDWAKAQELPMAAD